MIVLDLDLEGPVVEWRGPAPFWFLRIDAEDSADIKAAARGMEYWGQVPVVARIGDVEFTTALFWKDDGYLLPLKVAVRRATGVGEDGTVAVSLSVGRPEPTDRP